MKPLPPLLYLLSDPEIKASFVQLDSLPVPAEEKYQQFLVCCAGIDWTADPAPAGQRRSVAPVEGGLRAALAHGFLSLQQSQRADNGWGLPDGPSNFWHTAQALLFLKALDDLPDFRWKDEVTALFHSGAQYLEQHPEKWSVESLSDTGGMSFYELGLMAQCYTQAARGVFRRETVLRVYHNLNRLVQAQNRDGGWDASLWGSAVTTPTRVWSEVGATSVALHALAATHDLRFRMTMERGLRWLVQTQNRDGSWNDGSCDPAQPDYWVMGRADLEKTGMALLSILAGEAVDISLCKYLPSVLRGIDWLLRQPHGDDAPPRLREQAPADAFLLEIFVHVSASLLMRSSAPLGMLGREATFGGWTLPMDAMLWNSLALLAEHSDACANRLAALLAACTGTDEAPGWIARVGMALTGYDRQVRFGL
jgi:hypothetical protein